MSAGRTSLTARSFLFVPGTRLDRVPKALASGADIAVVDLEDAVEPSAKADARTKVADWLLNAADDVVGAHTIAVRINSVATDLGRADLAMLESLRNHRGLSTVIVPKVETAAEVELVGRTVGDAIYVLPIIETAAGLASVESVARAAGVGRLISGNLDLATDLGCDFGYLDGAVAAMVKLPIVVASRAAGLAAPIDGPDTGFSDPGPIVQSTRSARALGFGARICIHPAQVLPVHEGLEPSSRDVLWARRIVEAADGAVAGAFQLDGRMVDKPIVDQARRILAAVSG